MSDANHITRRSFLATSATGLSLAGLVSAQTSPVVGSQSPSWLRGQFHLRGWTNLNQQLPAILDSLSPFSPTRVSAMGKYPDNFHLSIVGLNDRNESVELVLTSISTQGAFGTVVYSQQRTDVRADSLKTHPREESRRMAARILTTSREALLTGQVLTLPERP